MHGYFKLEQLDEEKRYYDDPFNTEFIFLKKIKKSINKSDLNAFFKKLIDNYNDEIFLAKNGEWIPVIADNKMKEFEIFNWNIYEIKKILKDIKHKPSKVHIISRNDFKLCFEGYKGRDIKIIV